MLLFTYIKERIFWHKDRLTKKMSGRIDIPIRRVSNDSDYTFDKLHTENQIQLKDTTTQWITDPITNQEKFRIKINIEGFNQNEVIECFFLSS